MNPGMVPTDLACAGGLGPGSVKQEPQEGKTYLHGDEECRSS